MGKFAMFIIMTVYFMTVVGWPGVLAAPVWYTLIKAWSWTMRELENQAQCLVFTWSKNKEKWI